MDSDRRVTIRDIAREAGLSKGAVSYALNDKPGVSPETRERVMAIAEQLGWRASQAARSLSRSRAESIGLVLSRPAKLLGSEPFYMEFIAGVESVIASQGTALMLHVANGIDDEIDVYRRWWAQRRVDGVILVDLTEDDRRVGVVGEIGIPAVFVRDPRPAEHTSQIRTDDASAMRQAAQYLIRLGHINIARVAGNSDYTHVAIRNQTLVSVADEFGIPRPTIVATDFSGEAGARATRTLITSQNPPSAIIYDNDIMAVASLGVVAELGLDVPSELSLLAWDDSALCKITHPPLSAMHRDVEVLGARAATQLLELIAGGNQRSVDGPPTALIVRGTTSRPRR